MAPGEKKRLIRSARAIVVLWAVFALLMMAGPARADYVYAEVYTYDAGQCSSPHYLVGPRQPIALTPWNVSFGPGYSYCDSFVGGAGFYVWVPAP